MAFCSKCGAQIDDNATFCPQCGTQVGAADNNTTRANNNSTGNAYEKVNAAVDTVKDKLTNTKDHTAEFDQADIDANKGMSILAYIGILFLVPLLACKESKFAKFHANQGLILFIIDIIAGAIIATIGQIIIIGWIIDLALGLSILACIILGIINTSNGKAKELPFVGGIEILK